MSAGTRSTWLAYVEPKSARDAAILIRIPNATMAEASLVCIMSGLRNADLFETPVLVERRP
ncbi:MAG: hypothetical protein AAGB02_03060 [Pseudomonadota bacterium]